MIQKICNRRCSIPRCPIYFAATLFILGLPSQTVSADHPITTIATGTEPRGMAVNKTTNRLYVANYVSDDVTVISVA